MNTLKNSINNWLCVDTRTLAFFRIVFGFMGLFDVLRRYGFIDVFYSSAGMDFKRHVTSKHAIKYFSLLDHVDSSMGVHLFFIITAICFVLFIIGYRTRFFQILAVMGLISIHNAAVILENGADLVYNSYLIWALFLPLGTSWSVDSLRRSLQSSKENDSNDLNKPNVFLHEKIFHMGYVACLVQLSMIYFYNYVNKTGSMWHDGTAIHYMYQLDTFITFTGEWMRSILSVQVIKLLTLTTKFIEMLAPIAILSPLFQPWLRRGTFVVFILFHFIIALSVNVGMFSWVMMSILTLLLGSQEMDLLKKFFSRFKRRNYVVFYDRDCGFCHLCARILKRMDTYSRFTWADLLTEGKKPNGLDSLLKKSIVVWDKETDEIWIRHEGFNKLVSALPLGFMVAWILRVPFLEKVFGFAYDLIAKNRTSISKSMGLPACGLSNNDNSEENPVLNKRINFSFGKKTIWLVSNLLAFSLLVGSVDYSIRINKGLIDTSIKDKAKAKASLQTKKFKKIRRTMKHVLLYPRMYQEWNMFSPKVLMNETWLLAEIFFDNGEKLTLFKTSDDIENRFDRKYFKPYAMQFWRKLFERIGKKNYMRHLPKFKQWLRETDYFSDEYDGRKVKNIRLWRLSERSLAPSKDVSESRGVFKRELKQRDRNKLKNKDLLKKRKAKIPIKK